MAGIYNNNRPIPSNGADFFGDKLVGNQFVDGVSQFTLGNFEIKSNVNQKDSRNFSLGNFSEPISLETLNITSSEEAKILASNKLEVFINYNRSKITNFTLYGSLRERLKVAVSNIIKQFPAALVFKKIRDWSDYNSGNTATNISYNANLDKTNISLNLTNLYNPFSIEFTNTGNVYTDDSVSYLRNLSLEYKKYSLYYNDIEYPITYLKPTNGNTESGVLNIVVKGNPFSGISTTTESFHIKPNTLTTEEVFDNMEEIESFLIERTTNPIYTAKFDQPKETSTGKIVKSSVSVTWPSTNNWNLIISGGLFDSYLAKLYDIADTYDSYKTNLISRFLTTASLKEFDTFDEKVDKILKIYGRSFDDIKKYIDGLAYMANVTYDGLDNIPNELLKNFAQTLGWQTPSAIKNEGFLESIFERNTTVEYSGLKQNPTPTELNYELYRRLLSNTAYLFKSKGTRRGIEFMLRFVGAPEALIEFNEHVYVAGQPLNMREFKNYSLKISGGTYTEEVPVLSTYFSAATDTFPPIVITGYSYGYETVVRSTNIIPEVLPVDKDGYPTIPKYGADSYFQSGAGWFEETIEHQGKKVIDLENSVFTGNTPFVKTKLNQFSYGEPYLNLYRKFPDSKLGFPIVRTVDNKKSWVRKDSYQKRFLNLPDRGTNYQTNNDKLVINVKNVDIFLNVGQGLEWDVWNFSKKYSCPFGPNALSSPYPGVGGPDWTEIVADASKLSFFEFAQKFWTVLINVKNRQTIDDGHAGGYPTLLSIYLDYLKSEQTCGIPSNKYTYEKMIAYVEKMGDYWVRLLEQLVPSTTIWQGGIKYENSIFHRYKYAYKHEPLCNDLECFGSFVHCCYPITNDILVDATLECGGTNFSGATWQNQITLNGTVYTGNTYYSSTTITDIPSIDLWLDNMVSILSGITADLSDPNHVLRYYLINDTNTPTGININEPNCIVIQGPCSGGTDLWNYNNGTDPHCFKSDICLNLESDVVSPPVCEICIPICFQQRRGDINGYKENITYDYGDEVLYNGKIWVWLGYNGSYAGIPGVDGNWSLIGDAECIPFLGGNNFRPQDDCQDLVSIPENPILTGTTITTNPEIFKESIFNVSGKDCFEFSYSPCEELTNPCACTATYGQFDTSLTFFSLGEVVCCPGDTPIPWIRHDDYGCNVPAQFLTAYSNEVGLCDSVEPNYKCWKKCNIDNYGDNSTIDGIWSKEKVILPKKGLSILSNAPTDPCDPNIVNEDPCDCVGFGRRNIDLDFYVIPSSSLPPSILGFYMDVDQFDPLNWETPLNSINLGKAKAYKAKINACCLGDKLTHYFRVYNRLGPVAGVSSPEISYGDYIVDLNVDDNCIIEFYIVVFSPLSIQGSGARFYMHIPQTTISNNATVSVVDNPLLSSTNLTTDTAGATYFNQIKDLTFQLGAVNDLYTRFKLFKVNDSTYLTDNGTKSINEEINDIFDRYWALDSTGGSGNGLYGALTNQELVRVVSSNASTASFFNRRFNWEMELSCEGQQTIDLTFTANLLGPVSSDIPFTDTCGTDTSSPTINQNISAEANSGSISDIQNSGNIIKIPIDKTILDINSDIDIRNYNIIKSDMYIVNNFNPLQNSRVVNYNFPSLTLNPKEGLTYETFTDNGRERAKLSWLDDFTKGGKTKVSIEFVSDENKKRFEQDLKLKNVGQGVEFLPGNNKTTTDITSTNGKTKFVDLRDWATRSLGNIKDFSNSKIIYNESGLLDRFEIGPTFTTEIANSQYKIGTTPIGDPSTEFIISTMGSFKDYVSYQTGTTSSAITNTLSGITTYYSGYTNLSGYTDNQGRKLSPDFVFDISLNDNNMSYNGGIALSDPTFTEKRTVNGILTNDFKLLGDERRLRPVIPTRTLNTDNQIFFIPREDISSGGDYFYYKVPKTQNYRLQYKSCVNFEYFDEGWDSYLDIYRNQSGGLFPTNDYDFKRLINSSIIYGGGARSAEPIYKEGNVVNSTYGELGGLSDKLSPIFGYNPNNGIKDFYVNIYIERKLSGTTATTVIGGYTIANNPTQHPNADDYLFLPLNQSDKFTDLYNTSGLTAHTKIFEKKFIPYIDTGCIELNKDDEIRLRIQLDWENTTKNYGSSPTTSGLTASTISLKIGSDYSTLIPERPWFRVINKECNVPQTTTYLYWQPNEIGPVSTQLFSRGQSVQPTQGSEVGKMIFTENKDNLDYVTPNIKLSNMSKLTYLDLPEDKNYFGVLKLIPTTKKTNRWVEKLESNSISDFKINSSKLLNIEGMTLKWNVPVPTQNTINSISLDDAKYTYLIESTLQVKGTGKTFKLLNTFKPNFKTDTIKDIKVSPNGLILPTNITYTSSRPLEERTIGFDNNRTIIKDKIVAVESVIYDKNTPAIDNERTQYCKCGGGSYISVPYNSTVGCDQWCCVNSYENSTYYPCREKTIKEWANGLNLKRAILPNPTNGIIRGI